MPRGGIGSSNLNLSFNNGVLTTFGQEVDPKVIELITSLAGVPSQLAGADKIKAETKTILDTLSTAQNQSSKLPVIGTKIETISNDINAIQTDASYSVFIGSEQLTLDNVKNNLQSLSKAFKHLNAAKSQKALFKTLSEEKEKLFKIASKERGDLSQPQSVLVSKLAGVFNEINEILEKEKPKPIAKPVIELYEIIQSETGVKLKLVQIE